MASGLDRLSPDKARVTVILPVEVRDKGKKLAEQDDRSLSNLLTTLLKKYIKEHENEL